MADVCARAPAADPHHKAERAPTAWVFGVRVRLDVRRSARLEH